MPPFSTPSRRPCLLLLALFTLLTLLATPAAAQGGRGIAIGARAATTGFGAEIALPLGSRSGARLAATVGSYDLEVESQQVTYDGEVDLSSILAVLDLHPFAGRFRVSLGALVHDNTLTGEAPVRELLLREGVQVPPGLDLGRLVAEATVEPVAPYAGIGWGSAPHGARGLSLSIDLGAAWHGEPDVDVRYVGPLPLDDLLGAGVAQQILAEEERALEAEIAEYDLFPVVALTLTWRF